MSDLLAQAPATGAPARPASRATWKASIVAELAEVVVNRTVNAQYRHLVVRCGAEAAGAAPGQFFQLLCPHPPGEQPFLRRPMSLYGADPIRRQVEFLYKVAGAGTRGLDTLRPGDHLDILGPLGVGFTLDPGWRSIVAVGRGAGLATLAPLAQAAARRGPAPRPARRDHPERGRTRRGGLRQCGRPHRDDLGPQPPRLAQPRRGDGPRRFRGGRRRDAGCPGGGRPMNRDPRRGRAGPPAAAIALRRPAPPRDGATPSRGCAGAFLGARPPRTEPRVLAEGPRLHAPASGDVLGADQGAPPSADGRRAVAAFLTDRAAWSTHHDDRSRAAP
ncbi:hypothetical protein [Methylobacterium sp. WSM2598]|uniref:hypothetical protein n=1 Tax=Methylobacterium sp. WSM2598 TaxID=398261 RepID=UPI00039B7EEA